MTSRLAHNNILVHSTFLPTPCSFLSFLWRGAGWPSQSLQATAPELIQPVLLYKITKQQCLNINCFLSCGQPCTLWWLWDWQNFLTGYKGPVLHPPTFQNWYWICAVPNHKEIVFMKCYFTTFATFKALQISSWAVERWTKMNAKILWQVWQTEYKRHECYISMPHVTDWMWTSQMWRKCAINVTDQMWMSQLSHRANHLSQVAMGQGTNGSQSKHPTWK